MPELLEWRIVRNPTTGVMLLFGFAPLLAFYIAATPFQLLACLLTYSAVALTAYFYLVVARRTASLAFGLAVALFTMVVGSQMVIGLEQVPPLSSLYAAAIRRDGVPSVVGFFAGLAANEETWKAVPVLFLAFAVRRGTTPLDGMFYGALSGVGFAFREGLTYIGGASQGSDLLHQALIRTTTMPLLHATWSGIAGYFIGVAAATRRRQFAVSILGIATATTLHGLYDVAVEHILAVAIAAITYLLFVSYIERAELA